MRQVGIATWNEDHVTVHGADPTAGASFYCTGTRSDHSLCLHACDLLARAVASGLCAATIKVAAKRGIQLDDLAVEAAITVREESAELKLCGVELLVTTTCLGLTEPGFMKLVEEARSKCPTESLLAMTSKVTVTVKSPAPIEQS